VFSSSKFLGRKNPANRFAAPWRWVISVVALATLIGRLGCPLANAEQNNQSAREQKILRIQQLIEEHNLEEAQRQLAEATKQYPSDEGLQNLLGIVEAQQGKYEEAETNFRQAIRRAPKFTAAYLNLGRLYQENFPADPETQRKTLEVYQRVLEYEPANAEANYQSAVLFLRQGEYQNSLSHVSRLPTETQNSAQALSIRCADSAGLGNRQQTEAAVRRLLDAQDFSEADAQQALLGLVPAERDDLIVSMLENLQHREALSPALLQTLGVSYERVNRLADARTTLDKSFAAGKPSVDVLLELTRIARLEKDYQGALGYLAHAQALEPSNARLYYDFGVVCVDLSLIAESRNSFEKAVKLEPENPAYNYAMGAASAFRHDPAEAVPYFEKYLELKPQDPRGKLAMGAALFRAKDFDAARPWLKEAAATPATASKAHYYLGVMALEAGQLDEAVTELQQVLKDRPDDADALAELGQYCLLRKEYKQAEKYLERALQVDADHYAANFYLLTLYTRTKDARRAAEEQHFEALKKLLAEKTQEFLRIVEVRPFENP